MSLTSSAGEPRFDLARAKRWANGILGVFLLIGLGMGTWLSRIPSVRDHLGASTLEMSYYGLSLAIGSVTGLVLSGRTVPLLGTRRAVMVGAIGSAIGMSSAGLAFWLEQPIVGIACLFAFGFCFASTDVAMNVSGADADRYLPRSRMPMLHGGYSLGSVAALGIGSVAEAVGLPFPIHFVIMFALIVVGIWLSLRFVPGDGETLAASEALAAEAHEAHDRKARELAGESDEMPEVHTTAITGPIQIIDEARDADAAADQRDLGNTSPREAAHNAQATGGSAASRYTPWRDPRVYALGFLALSTGLAEGSASDWLPLALADNRGFENSLATTMLTVFFVAMTAMRMLGGRVLELLGRVAALRVSYIVLILGILLVILVPYTWASIAGAVCWGIGCALGFPVAISAAADDARHSARSISAVTSIAYASFLVGPIAIGFIGEHFGLFTAFWPIVAIAVIAFFLSGSARKRELS